MAFNKGYSSSEDETELDDYRGKNGVMFLVDFRQDMFEYDPTLENTYFRLCLNTCKALMIDIARSGKDDLVGISLMGAERDGDSCSPHLVNIQPLGSVSAGVVKTIDQIIVDNGDSLKDKYGNLDRSSGLNLVKILNSCIRLFLECNKKIYTKNVVLMSTDDDPFGSDIRSAHLARKQAKRLSDAAIDLIVIGLGNSFDQNKFYNELLALARGELDRNWKRINRVKKLNDIGNHLQSLMSRLSRTNRDLVLGEGISIPVSLYKLYKEPKAKFRRKFVQRPNEEEVCSEEGLNPRSRSPEGPVASKSGDSIPGTLDRLDVYENKLPLVGGKVINLSRRELEEQEFQEITVGLSVIGFIPSRDVPEYLSVKPPRLMLPNYFSKDGLKAFSCLLEVCREEKLSIVCWYRYNRKSKISLVVCHPLSEQSTNEGSHGPDSFCVVTVPFSDNYSGEPVVNDDDKLNANPSHKQVEAAKLIVKKLSVRYLVETFHDFELQRVLGMTEALALDYDTIPPVKDDTILDEEGIDSRIDALVEDFNDCSHLGPYDSVAASKRPAGETSFRATKNPKLSTVEGMLDTVREGKAEMLTVAQLKNVLDSQGITFPTSAKKQQLVLLATNRIK